MSRSVVIADDQQLVRSGLRMVLEARGIEGGFPVRARFVRAGPDRSAIHSPMAAKDRAPHSIAHMAADNSGVNR